MPAVDSARATHACDDIRLRACGQDLPSLPLIGGRLIPFSNRILQLSACCHTQLPHHLLYHPPAAPLLGSSLIEATTGDPVTKIVSQCAAKIIVASAKMLDAVQ